MRPPIDGDAPRTERTASSETATDDWPARHARTRQSCDGSNVRFDPEDDRGDDWFRRHGRTRGR